MEGADEADAERVLPLLEIEPLRARIVSERSAGQKKRVAIARTFLHERDVYLLDEPTADLDPKVASEIRDLILRRSRGRVVVCSSHNSFEARKMGSLVVALKSGKPNLCGRTADLRPTKHVVGVRVAVGEQYLPAANKERDYDISEPSGSHDVADPIEELGGKGVPFREVKEMGNPLEDPFAL